MRYLFPAKRVTHDFIVKGSPPKAVFSNNAYSVYFDRNYFEVKQYKVRFKGGVTGSLIAYAAHTVSFHLSMVCAVKSLPFAETSNLKHKYKKQPGEIQGLSGRYFTFSFKLLFRLWSASSL